MSALLGGGRIASVPVYASEVMPQTPDEVRRIAERVAGHGYAALQARLGAARP